MNHFHTTLRLCLLGALALAPFSPASAAGETTSVPKHTFAIKGADFVIDGKPTVLRSGEIHYPRTPHQYWRDRLKKAKAMGLNTVCTYTFWNVHEARRGEWNFTGDADVAEFCRIAQQEGLFVIVRPGPYICTEWDFGGYPGWLLADRTTKVRTTDPKFMKHARNYMLKIGEQLKDLQVTRGGPIIMVQVENEYGSFGNDPAFKQAHVDWMKEAGFEVPFFTSDGPGAWGGTLPGITATINFGGGAQKAFEALEKFRPGEPRMNAEFWVGWFDAWGKQHISTDPVAKAREFEWMMANDISVNIYMFHGGTNFGFMAGSNGNQKNDHTVDITSYDYSSILDEAGKPTKKFELFRNVLKKKFPNEKFPAVPEQIPMRALPAVNLTAQAPYTAALRSPIRGDSPRTMEELGESYGFVHYRTTVTGPQKSPLDLGKTRDRAIVMLDGEPVGVLDRRVNRNTLQLTVPAGQHRLELLVENLSRINFGRDMIAESKGLVQPPTLGGKPLSGWTMSTMPCDKPESLPFGPLDASAEGPRFYRGTFKVENAADTYLNLGKWGKGMVWVNGHNLGRFWNIGPQQFLYLPGCWLKPGADNEMIVLSLDKQDDLTIAGGTEQIWETRVDPDLYSRKPGQNPVFEDKDVVHTGKLANNDVWQTVRFAKPVKGRHLAFRALAAHDGGKFAAMTEIVFLDAEGKDIPREECLIDFADSEELKNENGSAKLVLDNQPTTHWHTEWSAKVSPGFPHCLIFDLGAERVVSGFRYEPRHGLETGRISDYSILLRPENFKGL